MNKAAKNQGKRPGGDDHPKNDRLQERPDPDQTKGLHGQTRSNQVKRDRQADHPQMLKGGIRCPKRGT